MGDLGSLSGMGRSPGMGRPPKRFVATNRKQQMLNAQVWGCAREGCMCDVGCVCVCLGLPGADRRKGSAGRLDLMASC